MEKSMVKELVYGAGWYGEEHDGFQPFRWMAREASLRLSLEPGKGEKFIEIIAGHSFAPEKPKLRVFIDGREAGEREIHPAFSAYLFPLTGEGEITVTLTLNRTFHAQGDGRELGIMVRSIRIINLEELQEPLYGEGWYEWEKGEIFPFRWMQGEARLFLPSSWRKGYLLIPISSEYFNQKQILSILWKGKEIARWPLLYQWNAYSLELPELPPSGSSDLKPAEDPGLMTREKKLDSAAKENLWERNDLNEAEVFSRAGGSEPIELIFKLNRLFPERYHPEDGRELGIRVGPISWHQDEGRHRDILFFHENAVKNYEEMMAGKTVLTSYPTNLGIDLYSRCNLSPPCVYCLYDRMKILEGEDKDIVVDDRTLASYGPFFNAARTVVNCSFGEPLLHPRLEEILEFCASRGKIVELSTNGQAFTARTIQALLGKPIYLYVSLDAASAETYAKIRNERFDEIVANLIRLNEERKKRKGLPKIFMVFMPMRVNLHELEAYFRLCQRIEADALVLRPLLYLEKPDIREERGGYLFDYEKELLSPEEIRKVISQAEEFSRKYKIPVANQFEFGQVAEPGRSKL
jgi:wyosine [tRNA(Phe)-imidazoG37] synthetase (radical SAM superfamily)